MSPKKVQVSLDTGTNAYAYQVTTSAGWIELAYTQEQTPWRQRHAQLSRELRDQPYLLPPPRPPTSP